MVGAETGEVEGWCRFLQHGRGEFMHIVRGPERNERAAGYLSAKP